MSDYKNKTVEKRNKTKYPNGKIEKKHGKTLEYSHVGDDVGEYLKEIGWIDNDEQWESMKDLCKRLGVKVLAVKGGETYLLRTNENTYNQR